MTTISALQAAVWTVLEQTPANYAPVDSYRFLFRDIPVTGDALSFYNLYTDMLAQVGKVTSFAGLESEFQLLTSDCAQDLLVRTSSVPLPGAAILLGLVGLRRSQIRCLRRSPVAAFRAASVTPWGRN